MVDCAKSHGHNNQLCLGSPAGLLSPSGLVSWLLAIGTILLASLPARAATEQPLIVAHATKVQLSVGEVIDFTITATFADADGGFYDLELDEQNLPDGLKVIDTGDSSTPLTTDIQAPRAGNAKVNGAKSIALDSVVQKRRFYTLRAIEPGTWVLPSAQLRAVGAGKTEQGLKTSPIYVVIQSSTASAAKGQQQAQPFFRLLPPEVAKTKDGKPLSYFQISGLIPSWRIALWRIVAMLAGLLVLLIAIWLIFGYGRDPVANRLGDNATKPLTLDQLRDALSQAAGRDRYPHEIKSSFDTVYKVLIHYGRSFLYEDFRTALPRHVQKSNRFINPQQKEQFVTALHNCQQVRFTTEDHLESGLDRQLLHNTVALAQAVLIAPPIAETSDV